MVNGSEVEIVRPFSYLSYWKPISTRRLLVMAACVQVIATIRAFQIERWSRSEIKLDGLLCGVLERIVVIHDEVNEGLLR